MTNADWSQLQHFTPNEFVAPLKMGYEFMLWLDRVRTDAGVPMRITSSVRTVSYNRSVGGAQNSAHADPLCEAVDVGMAPNPADPHWNFARFKIIDSALKLGCQRIGIYPSGSLHLDRSESERPSPRLWIQVDNPAR